jgi:hypothetical protein
MAVASIRKTAISTSRWKGKPPFILGGLLLLSSLASAQTTKPAKKLIEYGWDAPDTSYMRTHIATMEQTPFDGCVFHVNYARADGTTGQFVWECWSRRAFMEADLRAAIDDLKATHFKKFTSNFLRFNTAPGDVDWFDDFGPIISNARLAAKIAREGKAAGVLFDIEHYNFPLFDYRKQRDAGSKSWEQYATQARQRGREVMQAFQEGYPDLTILMTWATSLPYIQTQGDPAKLKEVDYGLLAPFLDGMLESATGKTRIIDGYESSYAYKDMENFVNARQLMKEKVLAMTNLDEKHRQHVSAGFGVWMDYNWREFGWNVSDFSRNFFTPEAFEKTMRAAWETADEYVWVYTEDPRWWAGEGKPAKVPPEYDQALRRATAR